MKKFFEKFLWWFYSAMGFLFLILLSWIAYWAYVSMSDVTTGQPLTASTFNQVLENVRVLRTDVDQSSPAWAIMAFNLSSCPTGWIAANGANGTPDLRGEFIRWLDSGRWVDSGRSLATSQLATQIASNVSNANYSNNRNSFAWIRFLTDQEAVLNFDSEVTLSWNNDNWVWRTWWLFTSASVHFRTSRPRNVALLYCVKQ